MKFLGVSLTIQTACLVAIIVMVTVQAFGGIELVLPILLTLLGQALLSLVTSFIIDRK